MEPLTTWVLFVAWLLLSNGEAMLVGGYTQELCEANVQVRASFPASRVYVVANAQVAA